MFAVPQTVCRLPHPLLIPPIVSRSRGFCFSPGATHRITIDSVQMDVLVCERPTDVHDREVNLCSDLVTW